MKFQLLIFVFVFTCCSTLFGQEISWEVNDSKSWEAIRESSSNLTITDDGKTMPANTLGDYTFKSKIITFDRQVDAKDIVFKQSPIWDNWTPVSNIGPGDAKDAPVIVPVGDGNYYFLGLGSTGGYHAWHSTDMKTWTDKGPVTPPGIGRWVTSAEMLNGSFYIYADDLNDETPRLFIDDNLDDGIPGKDMGHVFRKDTPGSDCSLFRDDTDGLFHLIYEDWSPINARQNAWDSPLAGHTSSPDGINGFTADKHRPAVDVRTTPTGQFGTYTHPQQGTLTYEIHTPAQDAFGDWTSIKVGSQYYLFGDYDRHDGGLQVGRFTSESIYDEYDFVGALGNGHPDPTIGFAEGQFYLITQQATDYVSPGPWVDGVSARVGVDTNGDGTIDSRTNWQSIKETYDYRKKFLRVVATEDAKLNLASLPAGFGFQFEFRVDNSVVANVSPLMDKVRMTFSGSVPSGTNLALNKTATQSTTLLGGNASKAVDGNTNSTWSNGSISHTQAGGSINPWWRVDLGDVYAIENISIFNRTDPNCSGGIACAQRLAGAKVYIGDTNSTNPNDYTQVGTLTNGNIQHLSGVEASGRYVMIRLEREGILSLSEVQVYGSQGPSGVSFVPDPNKRYYLDVPQHNLRLATTGQSEDAYTTNTNTTGANVEWKFVAKDNGFWHLQRAAGGSVPRLRTDNSEFADMQGTGNSGVYTYYTFNAGASTNTHYLTLPDGPADHQRLQIAADGIVRFVPTVNQGTSVSFRITEVPSAKVTLYKHCNFNGAIASFGIGEYPNMPSVGLLNNDISSLRVPAGLQVTLFNGTNFNGSSITFIGDDNCLINNSFNDLTGSFIIEPAKKPNFIFIMVDDLGKEWVSTYGATEVETPNIDALADTGIKFNNAYSMPQCTPSRIALLTGQSPYANGWINHYDVPRWGHGANFDADKNPSFAKALRAEGYRTCAAGKWQINDFRVEPDAMVKAGFDEFCMWTGFETGNAPSAERYWDPYIHTKEGSRTYKGQFGPDVFSDFIVDFMEENKEEPMCIYYPMVLTHTPFVSTPFEPNLTTSYEKHQAMVRYTDFIVGKLVDALKDLDLDDNTYLVFTTDNGTVGGVIGPRDDVYVKGSKSSLSEAGINAPFLVITPNGVNYETDALIDFSDIYATLLDLAGVEQSNNLSGQGQSFADVLLESRQESQRDWILSMGGSPASINDNGKVVNFHTFRDRIIRDEQYKAYVNTNKEVYRIFDLENDPYETQNLIGKASISAVQNRFNNIVNTLPDKDGQPIYDIINSNVPNANIANLNSNSQRQNNGIDDKNMVPLSTCEAFIAQPGASGVCQSSNTRSSDRALSVTPEFGQKSNLQWYYLQEESKKVKEYVIRYSTSEEVEMLDLEVIPAEAIDGMIKYEYLHHTPVVGVNYYQVIVQFEDGTANYQMTGELSFEEQLGAIQIAPNPTDGNLFINLEKYMETSVDYFVSTIDGNQLLTGTWNSDHSDVVELNLDKLQNGLYIIYMKPKGYRAVATKFVVSKDY